MQLVRSAADYAEARQVKGPEGVHADKHGHPIPAGAVGSVWGLLPPPCGCAV